MDTTMPQILAVCTGNICRSPAIERLLAANLQGLVTVGSAGTAAVVGASISRPMKALLYEAGADTDNFAARQITPALINQADLILTAATTHRSAIVDLQPTAVHRTFTLLEFAARLHFVDLPGLTGTLNRDSLQALVRQAHQARPRLRPTTTDVPDPYRQDPEVYDTVFAMITQAVSSIVQVLTAISAQPPTVPPPMAGGGTAN